LKSGRAFPVTKKRRKFSVLGICYAFFVQKKAPAAADIVGLLRDWYRRHKRVLPWRDLPDDDLDHKAYLVLISEIMLQQTQVSRVTVLYKTFVQKFPDVRSLAAATNAEILIAWRGLGYNSRALRLRDAAKTIVTEHGGHFPRTLEGLMAIKGIGHYTAAAVLNFAFGIPAPCLDTNIRRIVHRVFDGPESPAGEWAVPDRHLLSKDEALVTAMPTREAAHLPAILMDFGSAVCTKRSPSCQACPLKESCRSAFNVPAPTKGVRQAKIRKEPGRLISGTFTPNRLVRGRIVEALRDHQCGLTLRELGPFAANDWEAGIYEPWLQSILERLISDGILEYVRSKYRIAR
jgi:A/G-specific adenine glycosylase